MKAIAPATLLVLAVSSLWLAGAQERSGRSSSDPELAALKQQNAVLEEKIKLILQQQQLDRDDSPAKQSEVLDERILLNSQVQSLLKLSAPRNIRRAIPVNGERTDEPLIENARIAFTALHSIAPEVAKELACGGKNVVLYGRSHSETLLSVRTFSDQVDLLRGRLKSVLDIQAPAAPDHTATAASGVFGVAGMAGPVSQSVLDLISLFHTDPALTSAEMTADETGLIAVIANAAAAQGCIVYWPDQYAANPFNAASGVMARLQAVADLNDSGGAAGKTPGLQQRIRTLRTELKRSEAMSQALTQKIEAEQRRVAAAADRVDSLRSRMDWIFQHIHDEKDSALQGRLNKTFERVWDELETTVKKKLAFPLPQSMEDQSRLGEVAKRVELLKTQTDLLSQYVKDEKVLALQDKLKRALASTWEEMEAAVKEQRAATAGVPKTIEPDQTEQKRWDRYSAELREVITTTTAAAEAYTTFRGALLDGSSGSSPLSRMLRAEALRDLTFDEKFQERPGSSVVQLKLQKLTGSVSKPRPDAKETFSGGVILSFFQYEPNGKLKNSAVHTAYTGFRGEP